MGADEQHHLMEKKVNFTYTTKQVVIKKKTYIPPNQKINTILISLENPNPEKEKREKNSMIVCREKRRCLYLCPLSSSIHGLKRGGKGSYAVFCWRKNQQLSLSSKLVLKAKDGNTWDLRGYLWCLLGLVYSLFTSISRNEKGHSCLLLFFRYLSFFRLQKWV